MAIFVDLGEKKCSEEVKLDGSGEWCPSGTCRTALSNHLADLDIVIIKRCLNQVQCATPTERHTLEGFFPSRNETKLRD